MRPDNKKAGSGQATGKYGHSLGANNGHCSQNEYTNPTKIAKDFEHQESQIAVEGCVMSDTLMQYPDDRNNEIAHQSELESGDAFFSPDINGQNNRHNVHHVHCSKEEQEELEKHIATVKNVIEQGKDDPGLYASDAFKAALRFVRKNDEEVWYRLRVRIKEGKPSGVLFSDIDDATRPYDEEGGGDKNTASTLIGLVTDECDLFYDTTTRDAFGTIKNQNLTLKVGSSNFTQWLSHAYYIGSGKKKSASEAAIKQASWTIKGICLHEGKQEQVFMRAGMHNETCAYYLFMGDEKNRAIELTTTGWRACDQYPVKFWKPASSAALPEPVAGGDVNKLWEFCNIPEGVRLLVLAWLLECYRVDTPFPVLELNGVQGSAKSTTMNNLRMLVDPSTVNLRSAPKSVEDIYVCAGNNHLLAYENISYLPAKTQDAYCTIATGGGAGGRTLFTNGEEYLVEVKRPIMINGIPSLITAQDLTERSIHLELPRVERYLCEGDLQKDFEAALPEIFGGLLDLFVKTLFFLPSVKIAKPPRMVDYCRLGEAMAQSMGYDAGYFTEIYGSNRRESVLRSLESSPVASAVLELAEASPSDEVFKGTYKELLKKLKPYKGDNDGWPKSERGLSGTLKRQLPALQEAGVLVIPEQGQKKSNKGKTITVKWGEKREHSERCERQSLSLFEK